MATPNQVGQIRIPRYILAIIGGDYQVLLQADAVVEERATDTLVTTDHPVEQGSVITDHAYIMPVRLTLVYLWSLGGMQNTGMSQSFLRTIYSSALALQAGRVLVQVATGKRLFKNMLMESIEQVTDKDRENILELRIECKSIIYATTTVLTIQQSNQASPSQTGPLIPGGNQNLLPLNGLNLNGIFP